MSDERTLLIHRNPSVAALNHASRFDPVPPLLEILEDQKLKEPERTQMVLKFKKLWFRCVYPHGRIRVTAQEITAQSATIQAEIYLDHSDRTPVSNHIGSRNKENAPGGLFLQAAQYEAVDNALTDAGFGIQLCDVAGAFGQEAYSRPALTREPETSASGSADDAEQAKTDTVESKGRDISNKQVLHKSEECKTAQAIPSPEEGDKRTDAWQSGLSGEASSAPPQEVGQKEPAFTEMPSEQNSGDKETLRRNQTEAKDGGPADPKAVETGNPQASQEHTQSLKEGGLTLEQALQMVADVGSFHGKTLAEIADRRPTTLRWFFTTCPNSSEQLKEAARLVYESLNQQKIA